MARPVRPVPQTAAWDFLGDIGGLRGGRAGAPLFGAVPVPRASLHAHLDELWGVNGDLGGSFDGGAFYAGGAFEGVLHGRPWHESTSTGTPLRAVPLAAVPGGAPVTSRRLFPDVRNLLLGGDGAADDVAQLSWALGADGVAAAALHSGGGDALSIVPRNTPLAHLLSELEEKERLVVTRLSAILNADQLLPAAAKLAAVRGAAAQFGAVRDKILAAAAVTCADADAAAGGTPAEQALLGSALCAAGEADDAAHGGAMDDDDAAHHASPAAAGGADRERSASLEPGGGRRTRPQRKAAAASGSYNERLVAARAALEEEEDTPLGSAATKALRDWLFDHFLSPYPTDADKNELARRTGLKRMQVSNWFINARVRVWRPAIFAMCSELEGNAAAVGASSAAARR